MSASPVAQRGPSRASVDGNSLCFSSPVTLKDKNAFRRRPLCAYGRLFFPVLSRWLSQRQLRLGTWIFLKTLRELVPDVQSCSGSGSPGRGDSLPGPWVSALLLAPVCAEAAAGTLTLGLWPWANPEQEGGPHNLSTLGCRWRL